VAQPLTPSLFIVTSTKAINIEFEKFRQQKKQQGVEAHPHAIAAMFARTMSCPNIQKSMDSFVNTTSVKMKAEARQRHHLEGVVVEDDATSDPTIQMRVDELFVEFGVRPARSVPYELSEENTTRTKSRPSNEHGDVTDHHLDSIIQLKLQLAQKQAAYDLLSSKYVATLLQKSEQQKLLAENSSLKRENERLRAQLHQAGTTSAAANQLKSSFSLSSGSSRSKLALSFRQCSQPARVAVNKVDATSPPVPLQPSPSLTNLLQGWRNRPTRDGKSS
jgi:regulator of replication initiation timing